MSDTIKLKYPIEAEGNNVTEITLRRPTVKDMLVADSKGNEAEKEVRLFANLSELPTSAIESLDLADYHELQRAYQGFLS